ncbi:16S rRNA (guanine(527)-N(7))-methyltransferase RsmG [Temperatibacter marinus]|uniref:Ribosomal RNA small subunit methyltransferase G n=1 Tax=Temperatibacter marinus TaxID=1456591 RepID=A0AA52EFA7_9PROT|nr:16S rRNA (guanine(527)-N(7))-methyltransferase RsmG [Temperatibacter marinus]WND03675.1 16S rRNA (guanine(527)-N(7))-methyltransferase RsmG [Temperatibacter marinus]
MSIDIIKAHLDVSRETCDSLEKYAALLQKWQPAKNLIANSTLPDLWERHFLDSAQLYPLIRKIHGERELTYLDIGSGAGFPGLVLSAMGLGQAHMVESNHKKAIFMGQVARSNKLQAKVHNERIEDLDVFPVDLITSRACATIEKLLDWTRPFIGEATEMWLLKGAIADDELTLAKKSWTMEIERFESLTDSSGVILRLYNIKNI